MITKHLMQPPEPPRQREPNWHIPASFEAICLRALAKKPGDRFPTALAMSEELTRAVRSLGDSARLRLDQFLPATPRPAPKLATPPRRAKKALPSSLRRRRLGLVLMIACGALALAMWFVRP